jgi:hypothetical protein
MTTLHIMLASGENLPNLIPAITKLKEDSAFKAGSALILASKEMRERARMLKSALESADVRSVSIHSENCPDHNLGEIRQWAQQRAAEITANYHDDRRILNLTGGNKLMTIAFLEAFQNRNTEIIYCDTEHNCIEYIQDDKPDLRLPVNILKLKVYLAAQGYRLREEEVNRSGIQVRAELTHQLVESAPHIEKLISNLNRAYYDYEKNPFASVSTNKLVAKEQDLLQLIEQNNLLKPSHTFQDESAARYLGGGWLEEWCWIVGKELEEGETGRRLQGDRWGIGLKIDPTDMPNIPGRNRLSLNELDAVYIHRNRMLLLECKTGMQISDAGESQDILNKLEALGKHVSGRLDTKWLLTARRINPNSQAKERAERYRIRLIEPEALVTLKNEIYQWMTN